MEAPATMPCQIRQALAEAEAEQASAESAARVEAELRSIPAGVIVVWNNQITVENASARSRRARGCVISSRPSPGCAIRARNSSSSAPNPGSLPWNLRRVGRFMPRYALSQGSSTSLAKRRGFPSPRTRLIQKLSMSFHVESFVFSVGFIQNF